MGDPSPPPKKRSFKNSSPRRQSKALTYLKNSPYTQAQRRNSTRLENKSSSFKKKKKTKVNRKSIFVASISPIKKNVMRTNSFFNFSKNTSLLQKKNNRSPFKKQGSNKNKKSINDTKLAGKLWVRIVSGNNLKAW